MSYIDAPALDHDAMMETKYGSKPHARGRRERRIVANLIYHLMLHGFRPTGVWDGEVFECTDGIKDSMEFIFNLDECSLRFAKMEGFDRRSHERTRGGQNDYADNEHGVLLICGNDEDIICDYNSYTDDRDGFAAAMEAFEVIEHC